MVGIPRDAAGQITDVALEATLTAMDNARVDGAAAARAEIGERTTYNFKRFCRDRGVDISGDVSIAVRDFLIQGLNASAQVFDFGDVLLKIGQTVRIRCGENGLNVYPSTRDRTSIKIENATFEWSGGDLGPDNYIIDWGCASTLYAEAAWRDVKFNNVNFDGRNITGLIKYFNFYNVIFTGCHFRNHGNYVGVLLSSHDDEDNYVDDNGATFNECRFSCLPASSNFTGPPIKAYCGDIVVESGKSEWCGPHEYHVGSIWIRGHHWSYGAGTPTALRECAIFRDPREIQLIACDVDTGTFRFTNAGWMDGRVFTGPLAPSQTARTGFRSIMIVANEQYAGVIPTAGAGALATFETEAASTYLSAVTIHGNPIEIGGNGDDAAPEITFRTIGAGSFSTISMHRVFPDAYGMTPGDGGIDAAPLYDGDSTLQAPGRERRQVRASRADAYVVTCLYRGQTLVAKTDASGTVYSGKFSTLSGTAAMRDGGSNNLIFRAGGTDRLEIASNGVLRPVADGSQSMGSLTQRFSASYVMTPHFWPAASATPTVSGEMLFELTSDTQLKVKVKGSDGTVRSVALTLA